MTATAECRIDVNAVAVGQQMRRLPAARAPNGARLRAAILSGTFTFNAQLKRELSSRFRQPASKRGTLVLCEPRRIP